MSPARKALAALLQHPDDTQARRVCADRLLELGEPLGELINLQCEGASRTPALEAREQALITELSARLEQAARRAGSLTWRQGFVDSVDYEVTGITDAGPVPALATELAARLLRSLTLTGLVEDGDGDLEPALAALQFNAAAFPCLVELRVEIGLDLGNPWLEGPLRLGELSGLWPAFPRLEVVELHGTDHRLGRLELPHLRTFAASGLPASAVAELRQARWPSLTSLELHFGAQPPAQLRPALASLLELELPASVGTLSVAAVEGLMPFLCQHLPSSRLARHARVLGFRHARFYPDAAEALAGQRAALQRFEAVEIRQWRLEPGVKQSLERLLGPRLRLGN